MKKCRSAQDIRQVTDLFNFHLQSKPIYAATVIGKLFVLRRWIGQHTVACIIFDRVLLSLLCAAMKEAVYEIFGSGEV